MPKAKEFASARINGEWVVVWRGCDGRTVCRCAREYEAVGIASALNDTDAASRWYKRASVALGLKDAR